MFVKKFRLLILVASMFAPISYGEEEFRTWTIEGQDYTLKFVYVATLSGQREARFSQPNGFVDVWPLDRLSESDRAYILEKVNTVPKPEIIVKSVRLRVSPRPFMRTIVIWKSYASNMWRLEAASSPNGPWAVVESDPDTFIDIDGVFGGEFIETVSGDEFAPKRFFRVVEKE